MNYKNLLRGKNGGQRTVDSLRRAGYRVIISHRRRYASQLSQEPVFLTKHQASVDGVDHRLLPSGGVTYVYIQDKFGRQISSGQARCWNGDNFNRKLGLRIALGRAIHGHEAVLLLNADVYDQDGNLGMSLAGAHRSELTFA